MINKNLSNKSPRNKTHIPKNFTNIKHLHTLII